MWVVQFCATANELPSDMRALQIDASVDSRALFKVYVAAGLDLARDNPGHIRPAETNRTHLRVCERSCPQEKVHEQRGSHGALLWPHSALLGSIQIRVASCCVDQLAGRGSTNDAHLERAVITEAGLLTVIHTRQVWFVSLLDNAIGDEKRLP